MGNLITETPYSEITATLEVLSHYNLTREDLRKLRQDTYLARDVARLIKSGDLRSFFPKPPSWERLDSLMRNARRCIEDLQLSARAFNALRYNEDIHYVWQLLQYSELRLFKVKNLGVTSINEIKEKLAQIGLELGMRIPDGEPPAD